MIVVCSLPLNDVLGLLEKFNIVSQIVTVVNLVGAVITIFVIRLVVMHVLIAAFVVFEDLLIGVIRLLAVFIPGLVLMFTVIWIDLLFNLLILVVTHGHYALPLL